jgi:hypothetical protein
MRSWAFLTREIFSASQLECAAGFFATLGAACLAMPPLVSLYVDWNFIDRDPFTPSLTIDLDYFLFGSACLILAIPLSIACLRRRYYFMAIYGLVLAGGTALLGWNLSTENVPGVLRDWYDIFWHTFGS